MLGWLLREFRDEPHPVHFGISIECPDGLVVGATVDDNGVEHGGEWVPCGRQQSVDGACRRCGGRTWVPAGPPESNPMQLQAARTTKNGTISAACGNPVNISTENLCKKCGMLLNGENFPQAEDEISRFSATFCTC